ncbi:family 78 glycoside hydrolase catalytic domain [Umezawaea sp. Da 62-37]|uniref:family 78 glycoside hydrolase catalytic domain n=1 Tax=Umezawaea sp. Da 62-37 TaxID=3075927 RepID=UPI0028F700EE|nr:family 78 glycoside hydrolase catalytic domain [Umezawaea sp. Da 62-37]WNV88933.1 family 78 glycoside hydrolase catalytic domain [Umezawaea sp. Da 62-37]
MDLSGIPGGRRSRLIALVAAALAASSILAPTTATADSRGGALAPTSLRANGQASNALVGGTPLTLAWTVNDSGRAQAQTAYELSVDSPRGHWGSGRVSSSNSVDVRYSGPALASDRTYQWTVRTWNSQGERSPWSAPAKFDTGLLAPADWSAWWIQADDGSLLRDDFELTKQVSRARLHFGAQGLVEPHLNGARVEPKQVLDSSVTDYAQRVLYRDLDVTSLVRKGRNALAFMASKGQYAGKPTFVAQLSVTYTDGTTATFGTDPSWKAHAGPVVGADFYYGETYDARREIAGWDTADFDATAWPSARSVATAAHPQSLAQGKPVTALDTTSCCGWSPAAATDGIDGSTDSSQGYHSATEPTADATKWVQVDLGSTQRLASVSLFPARPTNDTAGDIVGAGFPVRYRVQVSDDPAFATSTTVADKTDADQPNPGTSPVTLPADVTGRYVRITATKLFCTGAICTFRLAELAVQGAKPAVVYSGLTRLEADPTPPTRIVSTTAPVAETRPAPGVRVYDFGQNRTGQVTLTAAQPAGTTAAVKKGEILDAGGRVTTSNISFNGGEPPRQNDRYTFSGTGTETYTPHFNYAGFRYAELTGVPDDATVTVAALEMHNDVPTTGSFSTSDAGINRIQAAVAQTQLNNLESMPLDCPTREKHGWLGDAGDTDQEAMANFDMQSFYAKWLDDVVTSAAPDGSIPSVAPVNGDNGWRPDPAWGTAYPQIIWDSYVQYGNTGVITAHYDHVKAWVDYLGTISDADHVVVNAPTSWGDDWLSTVSTPHQYFQTGFYYLDAQLLAKMAKATGNTADATRYTALAEQIAAGFTRRYFAADTGVFSTGTQLTYALPLVFGLVPKGREQATVDRLVSDIAAHGNHVTTGFVGTTLVFQALGAYQRNDVALAIAQRKDYPSFGYMLGQGPGTIWEKWDNSSAPDGTSSKDHIGLGGAVGQWFYQQLAGIQPGTSAYGEFTLAPSVVGDLTHVTAKQQTVRGTILSEWKRDGATVTYHATIPVGSKATIRLPLLGGKQSTVRESRRTIFSAGRPAERVTGLRVGAADDQALTVTAGSGDYTFTITPPRKAFTRLSITPGTPDAITAGGAGAVPVVVEGRSTVDTSAVLDAKLPAGWTATPTPARVPLTPADSATATSVRITVPDNAKSGVHPVTITARSAGGTTATTTAQVTVFGSWQAGTTASASTEHAPNEVNGAVRTYVAANAIDHDLATFWNDDTDNRYPDTLTVTTPSTGLGGVGFASHPDGVPTDFTVETWDGAQWVTQAQVSGNSAVHRWIPFTSPVTTTQVRVTVTGAQNSYTRIAELTP